jgi:hypothetical protein
MPPADKKQSTTCYLLRDVFLLAYSSTLNIKEIYSSETWEDFQWTRLRYVPDDRNVASIFIFICRSVLVVKALRLADQQLKDS